MVGRKPEAKVGLDEQESDTRPESLGKGALDSEARYSSGSGTGKSGEARPKASHLTPGGL
jgi:hypothetical protein